MKSDGINKKNRFYTVIHAVFAGLMRLIFRVEVINPENEPTDGRGMIVCCNHLSNADVVILVASMKNQVHFLAKSELFKIPLLGAFIRAIGAYPIKRGAADVGAIKKTIELADDGYTVGFFPQGTRKPICAFRNRYDCHAYKSGYTSSGARVKEFSHKTF